MHDFINENESGCFVTIKLVPGSSVSKTVDYTEEYIRIKISAPPIENRANKELISFLSKVTDINKSKIELVSGEKSKLKKVFFAGITKDYLVKKLCS